MSNDEKISVIDDVGKGFGRFVDEVLRGRKNKTVLNSSVALSALEIGAPSTIEHEIAGETFLEPFPYDFSHMVLNNDQMNAKGVDGWKEGAVNDTHPLFDFSPEEFTLFGLDFPDFLRQFGGEGATHTTPLYPENIAQTIGLPDLPYMEMAHFAHMGMALYDTGRTFQDVWKQLGDYYEQHNTSPEQQGLSIAAKLGKTITHPDMLHTLAARGTMLTVMGLLHPLGGVIAIGVAYLCAHLVHSAYGVLERNKEAIQKVESVPVLASIYNATGIKEWAERDVVKTDAPVSEAEKIDPFQELELTPERDIQMAKRDGRLDADLAPFRSSS